MPVNSTRHRKARVIDSSQTTLLLLLQRFPAWSRMVTNIMPPNPMALPVVSWSGSENYYSIVTYHAYPLAFGNCWKMS